jgi:hypothetical protein
MSDGCIKFLISNETLTGFDDGKRHNRFDDIEKYEDEGDEDDDYEFWYSQINEEEDAPPEESIHQRIHRGNRLWRLQA